MKSIFIEQKCLAHDCVCWKWHVSIVSIELSFAISLKQSNFLGKTSVFNRQGEILSPNIMFSIDLIERWLHIYDKYRLEQLLRDFELFRNLKQKELFSNLWQKEKFVSAVLMCTENGENWTWKRIKSYFPSLNIAASAIETSLLFEWFRMCLLL